MSPAFCFENGAEPRGLPLDWDVIIAGGGPAGSTAANIIAQAGLRVVIVEKSEFPRFHVGESLLPQGVNIFGRLGFDAESRGYLRKAGADFIDERLDLSASFNFEDGLGGDDKSYAWQVERAQFDHELLLCAERAGAALHQNEAVRELSFSSERVTVTTDAKQYTARYFVDATGQDALLARRRKTRKPIKGFGIAAVFTHFEDIPVEVDAELTATGNLKVLMRPGGWGWVIPLGGRKISLGMVSKEKGISPDELLEAVAESPFLSRVTEGARTMTPRIARNFSYKNLEPAGERFACVGDSACFLDPVFSSGVSLAMESAELMADILIPAIQENREGDAELMRPLSEKLRTAYECFGSTIKAFYDTKVVEHLFFYDDPIKDLRAGLISILAGDVWRDDNRFQTMLLNGRRRWTFDEQSE